MSVLKHVWKDESYTHPHTGNDEDVYTCRGCGIRIYHIPTTSDKNMPCLKASLEQGLLEDFDESA